MMSGKITDISFPPMTAKSKPGVSSPTDSRSSLKLEESEWVDHYDFFKLYKININKDDVTSSLEDGDTMEKILFTVQNSLVEDINEILTSLKFKIPKALKSRFRNMR